MKNSNLKRLLTAVIGMVTAAGVLTGCGSDFDASGYVKACMDANIRGEFAEYAKITNTDEGEMAAEYDKQLEAEMSMLDGLPIDEEKKDEFRDIISRMYDACKYEVGEAVKNDDGSYTVPVTVTKLTAYKDMVEGSEAFVQEYYDNAVEAGETPTEDDLYAAMFDWMAETLTASIENPQYGAEEVIEVTVQLSSDGKTYEISSDDLNTLIYSITDAADYV